MTAPWVPYRESLRTTVIRTVGIALVAGAALNLATRGRVAFGVAAVVMMWPSFGGHWVELWFLNWLRPRIPADRATQVAARLATWFVAGTIFLPAMAATASFLLNPAASQLPPFWAGGIGFIGVELVAQLALQLRGRASFYNSRG